MRRHRAPAFAAQVDSRASPRQSLVGATPRRLISWPRGKLAASRARTDLLVGAEPQHTRAVEDEFRLTLRHLQKHIPALQTTRHQCPFQLKSADLLLD